MWRIFYLLILACLVLKWILALFLLEPCQFWTIFGIGKGFDVHVGEPCSTVRDSDFGVVRLKVIVLCRVSYLQVV